MHGDFVSIAGGTAEEFGMAVRRDYIELDFGSADSAVAKGEGVDVEKSVVPEGAVRQQGGPFDCGLEVAFFGNSGGDVADGGLEVFVGLLHGQPVPRGGGVLLEPRECCGLDRGMVILSDGADDAGRVVHGRGGWEDAELVGADGGDRQLAAGIGDVGGVPEVRRGGCAEFAGR